MPVYQLGFFFSGYKQGWSETYYFTAPAGDPGSAMNLVVPLSQKRAALLGPSYELNTIRVGMYLDAGGVRVKRYTRLSEPNLKGNQKWFDAPPAVTLMADCYAAPPTTKHKKIYLRGLPSGIDDGGTAVDMTYSTFLSAWNGWVAAMQALPAGWLYGTDSALVMITNYVQDPVSGIVTFTFGGAGFPVWPNGIGNPNRIYIQFPGKSPLDGEKIVIPSSATTAVTKNPIGVAPFSLQGTCYTRSYTLIDLGVQAGGQLLGTIQPTRMVSHKVGKVSYASRGRSRTKVLW